ncbi:tyrosine-type recombinase/integrase [Desulfonatronum thioautotrophicum]|uniref:tyrosine-type recombinase/integrase n=1 Tax=Desulfonatronum thioautotrophicum TaxID=617001 RepID=UPI0005EBC445|nr:integrase arm-type DNA-binding domain-containing protein [Desulfonatronum thioautotrophicum]
MPLTVKKIDALKSKVKSYLEIDGGGLYLVVYPTGKKVWRFRYQFNGKRNQISLGAYPDLSLAEAREKAAEKRTLLADKKDPARERLKSGATFEEVARFWHERVKNSWTPEHAELTWLRIEQNLLPYIGRLLINDIKPIDMLETIRKIEERGAIDTAHRVRGIASNIFVFSIAEGRDHTDPAAIIRKALQPIRSRNFAALTKPDQVGALMRDIDEYQGSLTVCCALLFSALTFARPGEIRHAEWSEIDTESAMWTIPKEKTKKRREHLVPLSRQTLAVLDTLRPETGTGKYLFPSERGRSRCISENTVRTAIRTIGYSKEQMTAHGFRSTASTLLNESGLWDKQTIELQLAHVRQDKVEGAYNRSERLDDRRKMVQWYSDYLDKLRGE